MSAHRSPFQDGLHRFRRNPLALVASAYVVLVTVACALAPWISPHDPMEQRIWDQYATPWTASPERSTRLLARVGEEALLPDCAQGANTLTITRRESSESANYLLAVRDGRIVRLQALGKAPLERLDCRGARLQDLIDEHRALPTVEALVVGEPPPAGLIADGRAGVKFRLISEPRPVGYRITLTDDGVVDTIERLGDAAASPPPQALDVHADSLLALEVDGVAQERFYLLGTDQHGRDLLTMLLYGGRISLMVGVVATAVSLLIGVLYGAASGYLGGFTDRVMMAAVDVLYAVPFMFLVIVLLALFDRSLLLLFVALGAVQWLTMARIVRTQVMSLREQEFIAAARISGASTWQILARHLIPNCIGPIIIYATLTVPIIILEESFLAFLGLSVEWDGQALESWGSLVKIGSDAMEQQLWLLIAPAALMVSTLLALNICGDALRDAFDPQHQEHS